MGASVASSEARQGVATKGSRRTANIITTILRWLRKSPPAAGTRSSTHTDATREIGSRLGRIFVLTIGTQVQVAPFSDDHAMVCLSNDVRRAHGRSRAGIGVLFAVAAGRIPVRLSPVKVPLPLLQIAIDAALSLVGFQVRLDPQIFGYLDLGMERLPGFARKIGRLDVEPCFDSRTSTEGCRVDVAAAPRIDFAEAGYRFQ